jgi:transcriptional regulator with GAF, ATPase, and Fis domain
VAPDVMSFLEQYAYPGNVRELENIIERAVVLAEVDIIRNEDLELWDSAAETLSNGAESLIEHIPMNTEELKEMKRHIRDHAIESLESLFVRNALDRNGWNVTRAAEETGILRPNFQGMMKKLGISVRGEH